MSRGLAVLAAVLLVASLPAVAVQWTQMGTAATVVRDPDSRLPSIIFNTGLAYDETPAWMRLRISWEVFQVDGSEHIILYQYTKTTERRRGADHIYSASQHVLIEAGKQYGAQVSIEDLENGLSYTHSFTYFHPLSFDVGLRLVAWDGSEEADVTGLDDEELGQLVLLQQDTAAYDVLAEDVPLETFFSQYAEYPAAVILMPETGFDGNWGTKDKPLTVTFGLSVLAFKIPLPADQSGFQEQLVKYDQSFTGTVYAGSPGSGLGQGATLFVQDSIPVILNAAVEEQAARSE